MRVAMITTHKRRLHFWGLESQIRLAAWFENQAARWKEELVIGTLQPSLLWKSLC